MSLHHWLLFLGLLLLAMVLVNSALRDLPLTSPMVYLATGWVLGPAVMDALRPDPFGSTVLLQRMAELGLLVSLFAVGMQLRLGVRDRRWWLPAKLAFVSLALMVAMVAVVGVLLLGLDPGVAIVLGAILAPTDPVLASALQPQEEEDAQPVSFTLAAEGALNDGAAYPFAILGLAVAGLVPRPLAQWLLVDFLWATLGGMAIGYALGSLVGKAVVFLRSRHAQAIGLDVFLALGLIGVAAHHASETMRGSVEGFNEQMEKISEMGLVLLVGAMLPYAPLPAAVWWFVPLLLLVLRPLSVLPSCLGERFGWTQLALAGWFGIRGIGSLFYLLLALAAGISGAAAQLLVSLTLWTIAASIVLHGLSARPLMRWTAARRALRR